MRMPSAANGMSPTRMSNVIRSQSPAGRRTPSAKPAV